MLPVWGELRPQWGDGPSLAPSVPPSLGPVLWSVLPRHARPPCLVWQREPLPKPIFSCWKFLASAPLKLMMESLKMTLEAKHKQQKTWNHLESICSSTIHLRAPVSHVKQKIWFIIHISPVQPWLKQTTLMKCWFHASGTPFQIRGYLEP